MRCFFSQPFSAHHCCHSIPLRLCIQTPPPHPPPLPRRQNSPGIAFIPFDCRSAANAGSKQTASPITHCLSPVCCHVTRRRPGQQRGLAEHGGRRRPRKGEETQQEEGDLSEGGHQHHEGMALPAPNGESGSRPPAVSTRSATLMNLVTLVHTPPPPTTPPR